MRLHVCGVDGKEGRGSWLGAGNTNTQEARMERNRRAGDVVGPSIAPNLTLLSQVHFHTQHLGMMPQALAPTKTTPT